MASPHHRIRNSGDRGRQAGRSTTAPAPLRTFAIRATALLVPLLAGAAPLVGCRSHREDPAPHPAAAVPSPVRGAPAPPPRIDPDSTDSARALRDASADSALAAIDDSSLSPSCMPSSAFTLPRLLRCAERARHLKNQLRSEAGCPMYTDSCDTPLSLPLEDSVHRMVLTWQKALASEPMPPRHWPRFIRDEPVGDSLSLRLLPKVAASALAPGRRFLFLGAGPFLVQDQTENASVFASPDGGREIRYSLDAGMNTDSVLDALVSFPGLRYDVRFGPPVSSYESGPQSIHGIGSLDHVLRSIVPACFLTKRGMVPGRLVSIHHKLLSEDLCVRHQATIVLATPRPPSDEILAVLVPFDPLPLDSIVVRRSRRLWTADLDHDGIADLAGVMNTFVGIASDAMADIKWYVNIGGSWRLIDAAAELDCT